jgi:3-deoxy-7-phosphoheptulonate synthase
MTIMCASSGGRDCEKALDGNGRPLPARVSAPYRIAAREAREGCTVVKARGLTVGGGTVGVIAGPCSVEGREQILEVAHLVKQAGATALRGGAFKPRTSPYSFRGLGEAGLRLLAEAREQTGLAIVTEVLAIEHLPMVVECADVLQVGARNMQNYPLLEAVGATGLPVLLKRGPAATMEEFLLAAEYVLNTGNPHVILCERGIRTFEDHTRFTLPLTSVPYLHQRTHLPIIVDPSHGTGEASLVAAMARAAVAAGADGLIVEVHPAPAQALSDGFQALMPAEFGRMMEECRNVARALGRSLAGTQAAPASEYPQEGTRAARPHCRSIANCSCMRNPSP